MKSITKIAAMAILILSGCASQDYALYADSVQKSDIARFNAESAKYKAMSDIAASGSEAAKVAAVMAIALGNNNQTSQQNNKLQAPKSNAETALQWVGVLAPTIVQAYAIKTNAQISIAQSENATRVAESTNSAFVGIAGKIQSPTANVTTSTVTTDNHAVSMSGTGTLGSGTYSTSANQATDTRAVTLSGTGSLGSGAYSTNANPSSTTDSHNVTTPTTTTDSNNVNTPVNTTDSHNVIPPVTTPVTTPVTPTVP